MRVCSMLGVVFGFHIYRSVFHADSKSGVGSPIISTGNKMAATEIRTMAKWGIFLNAYRTQAKWTGPSVSDDLMPWDITFTKYYDIFRESAAILDSRLVFRVADTWIWQRLWENTARLVQVGDPSNHISNWSSQKVLSVEAKKQKIRRKEKDLWTPENQRISKHGKFGIQYGHRRMTEMKKFFFIMISNSWITRICKETYVLLLHFQTRSILRLVKNVIWKSEILWYLQW